MPAENNSFLRFFRVLISVTVCLYTAAMISSLFWFDYEGHSTHRAAAPLFVMMFVFPATATFIGVATVVLFSVDRIQARHLRHAPNNRPRPRIKLIWPAICLAGTTIGFVSLHAGAIFVFLLFYWVCTGRLAGGKGWSIRNFRSTRWDEKLALIAVSYLAISIASSQMYQIRAEILPVAPGTPEYAVQYDHQMKTSVKAALRRFPSPQSCLVDDAQATNRADLLRMDWDQIEYTSEAEVCIFRLLQEWGGVNEATEWLQAQGFNMTKFASSARPYKQRDGTLRVYAGWSIRENGPRFPTTGPVRRALRAVPYGMSVNVTYTPDGTQVMYLEISYSTL